MAEKYGIVRTDRVKATKNGHIHSVVYEEGILQNGFLGVLGGFKDGERELREIKKATDTSAPAVLVAHPELRYEQYKMTDNALNKFFVEAGEPARAYELVREDIFSVSIDMIKAIDEKPVKGNVVVLEAGSFKGLEATNFTNEAFVAQIEDIEQTGTMRVVGEAGSIGRTNEMVVLRVIRNA